MKSTLAALLAVGCCLHAAASMAQQATDPTVFNTGLVVNADKGDVQALAKLKELAESGDAHAQYDLGAHYLHTIKKFDEDLPRIIEWMQKAAEQGVSAAQLNLAVSLGISDKPWYDPVQALKWCNIGMALVLKENPDASKDQYAVFAANNAFQLSRSLTKEQVSEAEKLTRAWLAAHGVSADEEGHNLQAFLERHRPRKP